MTMRRFPLHLRIILPLAFIVFTTVAGLYIAVVDIDAARQRIERDGQMSVAFLMTHLQGEINSLVAEKNLGSRQEKIVSFSTTPQVKTMLLADENGKVLAANRYAWRGMPAAEVSRFDYRESGLALSAQKGIRKLDRDGKTILGYSPVIVGYTPGALRPDRLGTLYMEYDLSSLLDEARSEAIRQAMGFWLIVAGLAFALFLLIHLRVTRRVAQVVHALSRFAAGDMSSRALLAGDDEIAYLGRGFDDMAQKLALERDALEESKRYLQQLLANLPMAIVVHGPDTSIRYCNPAAQEILGLSESQLLGRTAIDPAWHFIREDGSTMPPEEYPVNRVIAEKEPLHGYVAGVVGSAEAAPRWVYVNAFADSSAQDELQQVIVSFTDITERRQAEERLRRSEKSLAEAQRIAHLGNWELDLVHNVLSWSAEIYRIFEIDPEKFGASYEAFLEAIHPDDRDRVNNAYTESVSSRKPYDIVHRLRMKDGRIKYVNEKCETHYAEDGKPLRSVGTVHDITERILDEQALRRLNRELRAISNCNQVLMRAEDEQSLLDEICRIICDDAGYLLAWVGYAENDEAKSIRIVSRAGIDSGYLDQAKLTWAETERGRGPSGTAIRTGKSICIQDFLIDPWAAPWREAARERGYRSSIALPLKDEGARTFGILNIYAEVPNAFTAEEMRLLEELAGDMAFGIRVLRNRIERQRAEEEVRKLNLELEQRVAERTAQLEAANKELEAFSYSVSHDLRSPLRAIDGFSRILLEDYADKLDDEGKRLLNVVRDNTVRMGQLIDDILQFSRAGRLEMNVSEVDLEALAHAVLDDLLQTAALPNLKVEIGRLPPAAGDRAMLRQVFANLLSNAVKFSRVNEHPRIEVGARAEGDETVYFVRDNGAGFDMQYAGKLFGVFQRLHGANEFEGTGIGLAIVKRIVTRHGGRVWAEGKVGEGAAFYFALPAKAV
jgi:PAS domain S-box-containing protein